MPVETVFDDFDNLKALASAFARVLDGEVSITEHFWQFLSSRYDSWLNQAFVDEKLTSVEASRLLNGRPGFAWLSKKPTPDERRYLTDLGFQVDKSYAMIASTAQSRNQSSETSWLVETDEQLNRWHDIYCQVFDADPRGRPDWDAIYKALGPSGESTLLLLLGGAHDDLGAIPAVYMADGRAGLYCFGTLPEHREQGLATELVLYSHALAREEGVTQATLEATDMGRSVYRSCGYEDIAPVYAVFSPDLLNEVAS